MINKEVKYQTGLKRLWASIVDSIVFLPFLLFGQWLYKLTNNNLQIFIWTTFLSFAPLFYSIILHYKYGQTIGKWVAGVKVFDLSETKRLSLKQSILRDLFFLIVQTAAVIYFSILLFQNNKTEYSISDYEDFTEQPIFWWKIIELITMLVNSKRRALHDFLAGSIVIRT